MTNPSANAQYPLAPRTVFTTSVATWGTLLLYQVISRRVAPFDASAAYPGIYRSPEAFQAFIPFALIGTFLSTVVVVLLYGFVMRKGGIGEALRYGALLCAFYFFGVSFTLYAQMNLGAEMFIQGSLRWMVGMLIASVVMGALAKPPHAV